MICPKCGKDNNDSNIFCSFCGADISATAHNSKAKKSNGISKNAATVIICTVALIAIIIGVVFAFLHFSKEEPSTIEAPFVYETDGAPFIYETENELFYCKDIKDGVESVCVSDNYAGVYMLSNDNKYIIYIEGERTGSNTLYALEWSNENAEKIPLGNNAYSIYYVLGSAEKIYYANKINEEERELFCTDLSGNSQSIMRFENDFNMPWEWTSKGNAKNLILVAQNENEKLDIIAVNTESNSHYTISSNCDDYYNCSFPGNKWHFNYADYDNASKIYFIEDNILYSSDMFGNKEMISSDARDVRVNGTDVYYQTIDNVFEDVYSDSYLYGEYDDYNSNDNPTYLSTGSVYYYDELTGNNLRLLSNVTAEKIEYEISSGKNQAINIVLYLRNCTNYDAYDFNFDYEYPYNNFVEDELNPYNIDFDEEYYVLSGENAINITTGYTVDDIEACPEQEGCLITCLPNGVKKHTDSYYENNRKIYYLPKNASSFDDAKMAAQNVFGYAYTETVNGNEIIIKDVIREDIEDDYVETFTAVIGKDEIKNVCYMTSDGENLYYYTPKKDEIYEVYKYSDLGSQYLGESQYMLDDLGVIKNGRLYASTNYNQETETFDIVCYEGEKKYTVATDVLEISYIYSSSSFYEVFY